MAILALMAVRFIVRLSTRRPAQASTDYAVLDRIAPVTHYGLYILVLSMVGTGFATAILAGLNRTVFQRSGEPLPLDFAGYPSFVAHGYLALLLVGFVVFHVLAALYHQFVLRDRLFRRMWFGRRVSNPSAPPQYSVEDHLA
jgi:cytochrome b561